MRKPGMPARVVLLGGWAMASVASAQEAVASGASGAADGGVRAAGVAFAAALAMGLSVLGAGLAVGRIGSAALGAAAEKPELLTRSLLFVSLAEGLAVLGFAVAIMLLQKI